MPSRRADPYQILDDARQPRTVRVFEVELIPPNAVAMHAAGQREAQMPDGKPFDESGGPEMEFGDDPVIVLAFGAKFLDAANHRAVDRPHAPPEQQLDAPFIFFRQAVLPESWQ